ncbi:MAG TPA: hypothetical protein VGW12_22650 [Pyrinomonadaceae bacterium]|nr:hypothetical protein [Pyrinomonadaceae bacterium]
MSKLGCECGSTISDTTDNIPYKGAIIRDQDKEALYDQMASDLNAFMKAVLQDKRDEWLRHYFLPGYPVENIKDEEVFSDILFRYVISPSLDIYQCMECGSIKIQTEAASNTFASFTARAWEKGRPSILQAPR